MSDPDEEREVVRLWRVNRTVHELARDRGYLIADGEIELSLAEFKQGYYGSTGVMGERARLNFYATSGGGGGEGEGEETRQLYIFFASERNVGVKTMRVFITTLEEKGIPNGIIVYQNSMTPASTKVINAMAGKFQIEAFMESELLVNITKHELVPKHQLMTPSEKTALLKLYRLKETQLPRIHVHDPIARYYGLKRGQVVKITRPSETAGRYVTYRIVL